MLNWLRILYVFYFHFIKNFNFPTGVLFCTHLPPNTPSPAPCGHRCTRARFKLLPISFKKPNYCLFRVKKPNSEMSLINFIVPLCPTFERSRILLTKTVAAFACKISFSSKVLNPSTILHFFNFGGF